jgi:hypothetical protein
MHREKEMLLATLEYLERHEAAALSGNVTFQLDIKVIVV